MRDERREMKVYIKRDGEDDKIYGCVDEIVIIADDHSKFTISATEHNIEVSSVGILGIVPVDSGTVLLEDR